MIDDRRSRRLLSSASRGDSGIRAAPGSGIRAVPAGSGILAAPANGAREVVRREGAGSEKQPTTLARGSGVRGGSGAAGRHGVGGGGGGG